MAGFMSGFGAGFTKSFEQSRDLKAQKEEDTFKLKYADYISQRDKREQWKKDDAKAVKLAKSIVSMTGQPEESWTAAADLLRNGMSEEQVLKQFRENTAVVASKANDQVGSAGNNPADPREDLTQSASNSVNAQMAASGMEKPAQGGIFGNIKQILQGPSIEDRVNRRISETAGVSEEQVQNTLKEDGYQPEPLPGSDEFQVTWQPKGTSFDPNKINNMNDAIAYQIWADENGSDADKTRAKTLVDAYRDNEQMKIRDTLREKGELFEIKRGAIKDKDGRGFGGMAYKSYDPNTGQETWKDAKGNVLEDNSVTPYNKQMEEEADNITKTFSKDVTDYNGQLNNFQQMATEAASLSSLSKQYPEAMGMSGQVFQFIDKYKRAGEGILQVLTPVGNKGLIVEEGGKTNFNLGGVMSSLAKTEEAIQHDLNSGGLVDRVSQTAAIASLMDIKATRLAYMYAATQGQSGRAVSQQEFEAFKQSAMGNQNPNTLTEGAASFLQSQYDQLKSKEQEFNKNNTMVRDFESQYGVQVPTKLAVGVDDIINENSNLKDNLDRVLGRDNPNLDKINPSSNPSQNNMKAVGKTPDGKVVYEDEKGERYVQ